MSEPTLRRREIGYVCHRGHYQFIGEDDYSACGSKKIATLMAESSRPEGELGWGTDYESDLDEAQASLIADLQKLGQEGSGKWVAERIFLRITALPKNGNTYQVHVSDLLEIMAEHGVTE